MTYDPELIGRLIREAREDDERTTEGRFGDDLLLVVRGGGNQLRIRKRTRTMADQLEAARAEVERLNAQPVRLFDKLCADRMADEIAVLVQRKVISSRCPAADALLDYRDPPQSPRSDRLLELEAAIDAYRAAKGNRP